VPDLLPPIINYADLVPEHIKDKFREEYRQMMAQRAAPIHSEVEERPSSASSGAPILLLAELAGNTMISLMSGGVGHDVVPLQRCALCHAFSAERFQLWYPPNPCTCLIALQAS
jgi:hypothetical protein